MGNSAYHLMMTGREKHCTPIVIQKCIIIIKKMASTSSWSRTAGDPSCRIIGLLVIAFLVSWGAYLAGFCLLLLTWPAPAEPEQLGQDNNINNNNLSKFDPSLYPFYVTLIGGPILGLAGILRAAMLTQSGTVSSFAYTAGVTLMTVLGTTYFVCAGHVADTTSGIISKVAYYDPYTTKQLDTVCLSLVLMLVGVTAEALCWTSIMTVTVTRYKKCQAKVLDNDIEQRVDGKEQKVLSYSSLLSPSLTRKLSVIFILLSGTGWLILASHINLNGCDEIHDIGPFYVGPVLFLIALLHAGGYSEKLGVLTCILSMLYVMLTGAGLINYGEAIRLHQHYCERTHTNNYCIMLAGGTVSLISWTCFLTLCQFYRARPVPLQAPDVQGAGEGYSSTRKQQQQEANCTLMIGPHLLPTIAAKK